jgi:hypothetical protein
VKGEVFDEIKGSLNPESIHQSFAMFKTVSWAVNEKEFNKSINLQFNFLMIS